MNLSPSGTIYIYIYTYIYPSYNISYIFHTKYFYVYIYIYVLFQHIPWAHIFIATHLTGIPWTPRNVTQLTMISTLKEMSKNCEAVKLQNWRFIGVYLVVDIPLWQLWVSQLGQLGLLFPIYIYIWKMKNVPNHQPVNTGFTTFPCLTRFLHPGCVFTFSWPEVPWMDYSGWAPPTQSWGYSS